MFIYPDTSSNMQITVLDVKGKDITLTVDPDDLVKDIKEKIEVNKLKNF